MKEDILHLLKQRKYSIDNLCKELPQHRSYQVVQTIIELIDENIIMFEDQLLTIKKGSNR